MSEKATTTLSAIFSLNRFSKYRLSEKVKHNLSCNHDRNWIISQYES